MKRTILEHSLRLFKSVPVEKQLTFYNEKEVKEVLEELLPHGLLLDSTLMSLPRTYLDQVIASSIELYGITNQQANSTFHKSWQKIAEATDIQLLVEQMAHYITTYGFEALGIYDESTVYIPFEKLDLPETERLNLTLIKAITMDKLKDKVMKMLTSGIALKQEQVKALVELSLNFKESLTKEEVEIIANREAKVQLYEHLGIMPASPVEFLRFVIYTFTGSTLLIKDTETITSIERALSTDRMIARAIDFFEAYIKQEGLSKLGSIFYRYKPIFLSFKGHSKDLNRIINRIRRSAVKSHKPVQKDLLNNLTELVVTNPDKVYTQDLRKALKNATIFRKVRLANALLFRVHSEYNAYMYRIRNGKSYAKEQKPLSDLDITHLETAFFIVENSIIGDLDHLTGKKVYIPEGIEYAAPTSEKNFVGNFPQNTVVEFNRDYAVGVHWYDLPEGRIDLDLSLVAIGQKIGWDSQYRTDNREILFSGDLTSAPLPNGSAEMFRIEKGTVGNYLLYLNYYNYIADRIVPYSIFVAEADETIEAKNLIDTANIVAMTKTEIDARQKLIGFVKSDEVSTKIYFTESAMGKGITAKRTDYATNALRYLTESTQISLKMNDLLKDVGVNFVEDKEEADIDLSPEALEKDTLINLLLPEEGR